MSTVSRAIRKIESKALISSIRLTHAGIHPSVRFVGRPFLQVVGRSAKITIGANTSLVSVTARTALALNHPVNIRAIRPGASVEIGEGVGISGGTIVAALRIRIGDGSLLGANVTICDTDFHPIASLSRASDPLPEPREGDGVTIGNNVFIGTGAIILKGTVIGDNSVVGAGAVVKGVFPSGVTLAGNPARVIRTIEFSREN